MRFVRASILAAVAALAVSAVPSAAEAALNSYVSVKGTKQGHIKGSVVTKGREGTIEALNWSHEIISPRDAASGLPTGKRQHKQFVFTAVIDRATPMLFDALANNETLSEVKIEVYRTDIRTGREALYYTIRLTNASIARVLQGTQPAPNRPPTDPQSEPIATYQLTYQRIEWTYADGGVTSMDDWESPGGA